MNGDAPTAGLHYPLITLGLPVRNGDEFLVQAIDSALAQSYPDFELLISDNCSSDRTQEICQAYAARDTRVRYFRQPADLGAMANFEWLARRAAGEFFMWCAHDDTRSPDSVLLLADALRRHPGAVIAYGETVERRRDGAEAAVDFNCDTRGLALPARLRKTAQLSFYHIYGMWRTSSLLRISICAAPLGNEAPMMMAAACLGEVVQIKGPVLYFLANRRSIISSRANGDATLPWGGMIQKLPRRLQPFAPRFAITHLLIITWRVVRAAGGNAAGFYATLLMTGWLAVKILEWIGRRIFGGRKNP